MELLKSFKNSENLKKIGLFLLIFSLFFPIRHVFYSNSAYLTGAYSDFTSFSLYLSDILFLGLFLLEIRGKTWLPRAHHVILWLTTWIFIDFLLNLENVNSLNYYFFARALILFAVYYWLYSTDKLPLKSVISWFIGLAAVQSLIALVQFASQKSIGLYQLGESHLAPNIDGVAKIVSHGTKFIRGYGTLPHPNLLSAFLFVAILFSLYKLFTITTQKQKIWQSSLLILNIFGLTTTFSRAGIGTTILITITFLTISTVKRGLTKRLLWISSLTILSFVISFVVFHNFLLSRATFTDQAVKARSFYNQIGLEMTKTHPITGLGLGTSVIHMQQFSSVHLQPWEIQPIHNYYLLTAAEVGIVGAILLLIVLLWHWYKLLLKTKTPSQGSDQQLFRFTLALVLLGFMILMLFDHYFYTIVPTQMLLWLILGLTAKEIGQQPNYL